jgi:hypothetical protein
MFVCFSVFSCTQQEKVNLHAYKLINKNLDYSNFRASQNISTIVEKLKSYQSESIWPKAQVLLDKIYTVQKLSDSTLNHIENLKSELKVLAGMELSEQIPKYENPNSSVVSSYFIQKGKAKELYASLVNLESNILNVDPYLKPFIIMDIHFFELEKNDGKTKEFAQTYFANLSVCEALTLLSSFQTEVRNFEERVIRAFSQNLVFFPTSGCNFS